MEYKVLKDIAKITMGQSPESSSYNSERDGLPFFQGNADFGELYPEERVWCNSPKKIAQPNDILISVRAPIGALNFAKTECCIGRGLAAISIENEAERNYVYHLLKARNGELNSKGTGSTFKAIGKKILEELLVPLIPLEEQAYRMQLMDLTEDIIRRRKKELEQLDELIKARFVEMFGDPIANGRGWESTTMKFICSKITDGEHGSVPRVETGHPFLNAKHIKQDGSIDWSTITYTSDEVHQKIYKRCNPEPGDILMTTTGTIGNIAIVPEIEPFSMDRGITLLKIAPEVVDAQFVSWLLRFDSMQGIMQENVHASAIGHLFLNKVEQLPIIVPPIDIQKQFADFVAQVDKSKLFYELAA